MPRLLKRERSELLVSAPATTAAPKSAEMILIMQQRAAQRKPLFIEGDFRIPLNNDIGLLGRRIIRLEDSYITETTLGRSTGYEEVEHCNTIPKPIFETIPLSPQNRTQVVQSVQNFAKMLRFFRTKRQFSRSKLASLCGVSSREIKKLELKIAHPCLSTALALASVLNVRLGELLLPGESTSG